MEQRNYRNSNRRITSLRLEDDKLSHTPNGQPKTRNGKLIYENDIPDIDTKEAALQYPKFKRYRRRKQKHRWKPNGITNNIEEWRRKNAIFKAVQVFFKKIRFR